MQVREEIQKEENNKNRLSEHNIQVFRQSFVTFSSLTHGMILVSFYTPWKRQKTRGFLCVFLCILYDPMVVTSASACWSTILSSLVFIC